MYCNSTKGSCEKCLYNSHCRNIFEPICDLNNFTCRGCYQDGECPNTHPYCNTSKGSCEECRNNTNCLNPSMPICDSISSTCRACHQDTDCPSTQPYCNFLKGSCEECLSNSNCSQLSKPICSLDTFTCQSCHGVQECPFTRPYCDFGKGSCEVCLSSLNCSNHLLPVCEQVNFTCRGCYHDLECPSTRPFCNMVNQSCNECLSNLNCSDPIRPICNLSNLTCRSCLQDTECSSDKPFCNIGKGNCESDHEISPAVEKALSVVSGAITTAAAASVPLMGMDPTLLWSLVKLCQAFYYFLFLNFNYPTNLRAFLSLFSIGKFRFLPNIGKAFPQNQYLFSPPNFYENEYRGFFLETAGSVIFLWTIALSVYGILVLSSRIKTSSLGKVIYYMNKGKNIAYSLFPAIWDSTCTEFLYGALLQLRIIGVSNFGLTLSTLFSLAIVAFAIISMTSRIIKLRRQQIRTGFSFQECLPLIEHVRRMLPPFPMVILYDLPFQQLFTLWFFNIGYILVLIKLQQVKQNKMIFFQECIYFLVNGLMAFFLIPDINPYQRENLGWCVMGLFGCLGIAQFGILIQRQGKLVFSSIKSYLKRKQAPNNPHKRFVKRKPKVTNVEPPPPIRKPKFRRTLRIVHV